MRAFLALLRDVLRDTRGGPVMKIFGGGGSAKPPPPPAPVPMPDPENPAFLADQRRRLRSRMGESGRAATVLTGNENDYSSDKLGSR